jgi:hypothetical protein
VTKPVWQTAGDGRRYRVEPWPQAVVVYCEHDTGEIAWSAEDALVLHADSAAWCDECADDLLERNFLIPVELHSPEVASGMRQFLGIEPDTETG